MEKHFGRNESAITPLSTAPEHLLLSLPQVITSSTDHPRQLSSAAGQHIRLACQACQRKKIKCDRTFPCGQCTRSGLHCVPSQRKPRARHISKKNVDSELRTRISKLESLVETLSGEVALHTDPGDDVHGDGSTPNSEKQVGRNGSSNAASPANSSEPTSITSPNVRKYIGSAFWASLTDEVSALREALEDEDPADEEPEAEFVEILTDPNSDEYDLLICPPGKIFVMPNAMAEPSLQAQIELYDMYSRSVAPIYHIFHDPSLYKLMVQNMPYLGYDPQSPPCRAVRYAVWFAAINAISEEEAQSRLGQSRAECLRQYRRFVDLALYQANIMLTTDLPTLQAMCTYLISARINDSSRRIWTMTALTVRVAQAIGLHAENTSHTPFEKEQRRRLWHQIRFLDIMTAHDRGTEPLVYEERSETPFPSNINDVEFDENSSTIVSHDNRLTDMSFGLMICDATCFIDRLNRPEYKPSGDTWQRRLDLAKEFGVLAQEKYHQFCDLPNPYHRLVDSVGQSIAASMILRAVRPMQRHISSVPPRVDSPYVLSIATECLRNNYKVVEDQELQAWRWLIWVQWHALSVALAGLCSIRDTELADEAWFYAEDAFHRLSEQIADARTGMLWRPIEKLHRKAMAFRNGIASFPTPPGQSSSGSGEDVQQVRQQQQAQAHQQAQRLPTIQHQQRQQQPPQAQQSRQQSFQHGSSHDVPGFNTSSSNTQTPSPNPFINNGRPNWAFPFDMNSPNTNNSSNNSHTQQQANLNTYQNGSYQAQQQNRPTPPPPQQQQQQHVHPSQPYNHLSSSAHQPAISNATSTDPSATSLTAFGPDVSWLDWERMMQDLPDINLDGTFIVPMENGIGGGVLNRDGISVGQGNNQDQGMQQHTHAHHHLQQPHQHRHQHQTHSGPLEHNPVVDTYGLDVSSRNADFAMF